MARKKSPEKAVWEQSVKEVFAKRGFNAIDEMVKVYQETIPLKPGDEKFIADLMDDYEVIPTPDGPTAKALRLKVKHRLHILFEAAQYGTPKLRSTETKGQVDYNFNISIKKFDEPSQVINVECKKIEDAA